MVIHKIDLYSGFPAWLDRAALAQFLNENMQPYEDRVEDVERGLDYALSDEPGKGGFILVGERDQQLVGALVMLGTGMKGYIPENLLLFVGVSPSLRGQGLGRRLCERAIAECSGDVCLHVETDNPAKRLYERLGFREKYAEMRLAR